MKKNKKKKEFSKTLLIQESILVWIVSLAVIAIAVLSMIYSSAADFAYLTALVPAIYAAYAVSQAAYYKKASKENTKGGIKYDTIMNQTEDYISEEDENSDENMM